MVSTWQFHVTGGALCLDFANTVSWRRSGAPIERLRTSADFASWGRQVGLLSRPQELRLNREAAVHRRQSLHTLTAARSLREAIFAIFVPLSERDVPADGDLRELEAWIRIAVRHSSVVARHGRYRWEPAVAPLMEQVICHVALSANDLLFSDALHRIGQCSGRDCRWLWIDRTRNHTRRWCDMAVCGNRAKAHRHHQRRLALDAHLSEP